jgi:excisionase family DNA binding protein
MNNSDTAGSRRHGTAYSDILSVEDAARYLGVSKLSMYKLIRDDRRQVPVKRIAGAYKISRRQLLEWFESL